MNQTAASVFSKARIPSLDGLRAFSIICVLWSHAVITQGFPIQWALDGALGVRIFFVISGFIITTLMLREEAQNGSVSLKVFYQHRAARILPVFWVYLFFVAALGWLGVFHIHFCGDIVRPLTFTMGLGFWTRPIAWQTAHTWSLAIEEHFYLLWPPMFTLLPRKCRIPLIVAFIFSGPVTRWCIYEYPREWGLNWTIVGNADILAWGCLLALVRANDPGILATIVAWRPPIARLIAIVVIQFAPWYFWKAMVRKCPPLSTNAVSLSAQAAAIAYLIASLIDVRKGLLFYLLNQRFVIGLGVLSYSLYIWQQPFLIRSNGLSIFSHWPTNIITIFAVAIASFFVIERPIRSLFRPQRSCQ